jgi:hypothetical protein
VVERERERQEPTPVSMNWGGGGGGVVVAFSRLEALAIPTFHEGRQSG